MAGIYDIYLLFLRSEYHSKNLKSKTL